VRLPRELEVGDILLSPEKVGQAKRMASVYSLLYVLENSMREVIRRVMNAKYGGNW
jgi:hypothetical protein